MNARMMLAAAVLGAGAISAHADVVVYQEDFQTRSVFPEWSIESGTFRTVDRPSFSRFQGRYSQETARLAVPLPSDLRTRTLGDDDEQGPGGGGGTGGGGGGTGGGGSGGGGGGQPRGEFHFFFDLYIIDSWDGNDTQWGPDTFRVRANGVTLLEETFANQHWNQSMREPDVGRAYMDFAAAHMDSIYHLHLTMPDDGSNELRMSFNAFNLQSVNDESWGVDNFEIRYVVVPGPAPVAALCAAGLGVAARRRRR